MTGLHLHAAWALAVAGLAGCAGDDPIGSRSGPADAQDDSATGSPDLPDTAAGIDSGAGDTGEDPDDGLAWEGDLAPYPGCEDGDPPATPLSWTSPPATVAAGAVVSGEVVFANCSGGAWPAALSDDAPSGVKLGAATSTVWEAWGRPRVALPVDVPPDHAVRVAIDAVAPLTSGPYTWQWQLVDEWVAWLDAPTPALEVEVTGGYGPFWVHGREEWEADGYAVDGPTMDLSALEYVTIHYTGATIDLDGDDDVYTADDMVRLLRDTQAYYVDARGYSIGYNSAIGLDGDEWEARGADFRSAANGCADVNRKGYAILVPTPSPEAAPTGAQVEGIRAAVLRVRASAAAAGNPRHLSINGHRDVRPLCGDGGATACPGEPLYSLLLDGALEP